MLRVVLRLIGVTSVVASVTMPAPAGAETRTTFQWPFAATSPWNSAIGSLAAYQPTTGACSNGLALAKLTNDVNAAQWSHNVIQAKSTDPVKTVVLNGKTVATIHVPASATPTLPTYSQGGDAHFHIVTPDGKFVDEMYEARTSGTKITVGGYNHNDLYGSGVGAGGVRAYGGSAIGGLMRTWELKAGNIRHALAFALPRTSQKLGPVWPATLQDDGANGTYKGQVPMGTLAAIPAGVDVTRLGLSAAGLVVARALQNYGAYDVDSSSDFTLYAEPDGESLVNTIRTDLPKLRAQLRCVTNNTAAHPGGGGTPRAPAAPAFAAGLF